MTTESNMIVGITIIIINLVPLLMRKYKLITITLTISLLIAIINNYLIA